MHIITDWGVLPWLECENMDTGWAWLAAYRDDRPMQRFRKISWSRNQPVRKATPLVKILPNMNGLRTDEDVDYFLFKNRKDTAVINYGSSWCTHCHEMFPHLISLSKLFQGFKYAVGQVDYMNHAADGVEYTPTFIVYKKGKKVDQFYGANAQQLYDHLWLHN